MCLPPENSMEKGLGKSLSSNGNLPEACRISPTTKNNIALFITIKLQLLRWERGD